jgi:Tfp pilus assembly protein PilF
VDARIRRARLLRRLGDPGGAVADYLRVLELRPELLDARLGLASARLESGSPAAALAEFERVLEGSPDHLEAQVGRASALAALARRPEARRAYEEVLAERPEDASARLAHAILLAEEGLTGRAEAELGALLDSAAEPELRARAAHNLGNLAAQRRAWDEARGLFERALELDPGLLPARLALGTVLLETGEPARAAEFRVVADRQPHSLAPRLFEIQALAAAGRLEEAHRRLAEAREVFGADDRLEATAAWLDRSAG